MRGYLNTKGEVAIKPQFIHASYFNEGLAAVSIKVNNEEKYGYINTKGEYIVKPIYGFAHDFENGVAIVLKDGEKGCIDKNGKYILPLQDKDISFVDGDMFIYYENGCNGVINKNGTVIIEPKYNSISRFIDGIAEVSISSDKDEISYGYIDKTGKYIWQPTK